MATDFELTADTVRSLLSEQHPDLADEPVTFGAAGWDNQLWRLGADLVVRLPWQTDAADELLLKEHRWLPELAPSLTLPIPLPLRLGKPSARYPHPWTVAAWVPGAPADSAPVTDGETAADQLAEFLSSLHRSAPPEAPQGRGRGTALAEVSAGVAQQLELLDVLCEAASGTADTPLPTPGRVTAIWDDALSAPEWSGTPVWLHADLHPERTSTVGPFHKWLLAIVRASRSTRSLGRHSNLASPAQTKTAAPKPNTPRKSHAAPSRSPPRRPTIPVMAVATVDR